MGHAFSDAAQPQAGDRASPAEQGAQPSGGDHSDGAAAAGAAQAEPEPPLRAAM